MRFESEISETNFSCSSHSDIFDAMSLVKHSAGDVVIQQGISILESYLCFKHLTAFFIGLCNIFLVPPLACEMNLVISCFLYT